MPIRRAMPAAAVLTLLLTALPGWAQAPGQPAPGSIPTPTPKPTTAPMPQPPTRTGPVAPGQTAPGAVPTPTPKPTTAPSATLDKRVDLNSAPADQLDALPGVGPARAKAIIAHRPYAELKDLVAKHALPQSVLDGIKGRVALANINASSAADLQRTLPGIGDVRAKAIVTGRPYTQPFDLVSKGVLTLGVFDGIKDLITY